MSTAESVMAKEPDAKGWGWGARALAGILALAFYVLSTGPMTFVVVKLNGGGTTVGWPLRILALPYAPLYRALDHAPAPIVRAWEAYDRFFYRLAAR